MEEGYTKFDCKLTNGKIKKKDIIQINNIRTILYELGLIGCYKNGIGFGNVSIRKEKNFIITGTKTGNKKELDENDYTLVTKCSFEKNFLECQGKINASSESLTHAAIYQANKNVNAIIHIHNLKMWKKLLNKVPTTKNVEYGTIEMTKEVFRLFKETSVEKKGIFVMKGHEEGIITFGKNLEEAKKIILEYFEK
jgi:L-ribulose-5-phosphate 4-epimerase